MMKRLALVAAFGIVIPAHAQGATVDPDHIVSVLRDAGYPAEYFSEEADYRQILSKSGNHQFLVELYDCENGTACETLEFFAGFPMEEPPTAEVLDAFPGPREGARISIDRRGDPSIQLPVELSGESLTDAEFIERLKSWETMLEAFVGFLVERPSTQAAPAAS